MNRYNYNRERSDYRVIYLIQRLLEQWELRENGSPIYGNELFDETEWEDIEWVANAPWAHSDDEGAIRVRLRWIVKLSELVGTFHSKSEFDNIKTDPLIGHWIVKNFTKLTNGGIKKIHFPNTSNEITHNIVVSNILTAQKELELAQKKSFEILTYDDSDNLVIHEKWRPAVYAVMLEIMESQIKTLPEATKKIHQPASRLPADIVKTPQMMFTISEMVKNWGATTPYRLNGKGVPLGDLSQIEKNLNDAPWASNNPRTNKYRILPRHHHDISTMVRNFHSYEDFVKLNLPDFAKNWLFNNLDKNCTHVQPHSRIILNCVSELRASVDPIISTLELINGSTEVTINENWMAALYEAKIKRPQQKYAVSEINHEDLKHAKGAVQHSLSFDWLGSNEIKHTETATKQIEFSDNVWFYLERLLAKYCDVAPGTTFMSVFITIDNYTEQFGWGKQTVIGWQKEMELSCCKANIYPYITTVGDTFKVDIPMWVHERIEKLHKAKKEKEPRFF